MLTRSGARNSVSPTFCPHDPVCPHASVDQPGPRDQLSPRHWLEFRKRETHDLKGSEPTCRASSAWSNLPLECIWENLQLVHIYYTDWPEEREFRRVSPWSP